MLRHITFRYFKRDSGIWWCKISKSVINMSQSYSYVVCVQLWKLQKDATKNYGWLHLHCTYHHCLRRWKDLASRSSGPRLSLSEVVRPRESQIEGKGVRSQEETSLAFHIPAYFTLNWHSQRGFWVQGSKRWKPTSGKAWHSFSVNVSMLSESYYEIAGQRARLLNFSCLSFNIFLPL